MARPRSPSEARLSLSAPSPAARRRERGSAGSPGSFPPGRSLFRASSPPTPAPRSPVDRAEEREGSRVLGLEPQRFFEQCSRFVVSLRRKIALGERRLGARAFRFAEKLDRFRRTVRLGEQSGERESSLLERRVAGERFPKIALGAGLVSRLSVPPRRGASNFLDPRVEARSLSRTHSELHRAVPLFPGPPLSKPGAHDTRGTPSGPARMRVRPRRCDSRGEARRRGSPSPSSRTPRCGGGFWNSTTASSNRPSSASTPPRRFCARMFPGSRTRTSRRPRALLARARPREQSSSCIRSKTSTRSLGSGRRARVALPRRRQVTEALESSFRLFVHRFRRSLLLRFRGPIELAAKPLSHIRRILRPEILGLAGIYPEVVELRPRCFDEFESVLAQEPELAPVELVEACRRSHRRRTGPRRPSISALPSRLTPSIVESRRNARELQDRGSDVDGADLASPPGATGRYSRALSPGAALSSSSRRRRAYGSTRRDPRDLRRDRR